VLDAFHVKRLVKRLHKEGPSVRFLFFLELCVRDRLHCVLQNLLEGFCRHTESFGASGNAVPIPQALVRRDNILGDALFGHLAVSALFLSLTSIHFETDYKNLAGVEMDSCNNCQSHQF
jgi:hypothetical protein